MNSISHSQQPEVEEQQSDVLDSALPYYLLLLVLAALALMALGVEEQLELPGPSVLS